MSRTGRTPTQGLSAAAAALVLPGPEGLTREQLETIYDACATTEVTHDAPNVDRAGGQGGPSERDLAWWAWCAEHVAAGGDCSTDDAVAAGAALHWDHQRSLAAQRGRAALSKAGAASARRAEQAAAFSAFTTWLAASDEDTEARVAAVVSERAAIRSATAHRDDTRAQQAALGAAGAAQLRALAALAPLYAAALDPAVVSVLDVALDLARIELLGALDDLVAELAPALSWTEYTTALRVRLAPRLVALLPHTMARLEAGELDLARALLVAERTERADAGVARRADDVLCGPGGSGIGLNSTALRKEVDRVLATIDAEAVKQRSRQKTAARGAAMRTLGDGMARWEVTGPLPAVAGLHRQLTALATVNRTEAQVAARQGRVAADGGDPYAVPGVDVADPADLGDVNALLADHRTVNAHRFDALVDAVSRARPADGSPRPQVGLEVLVSLPGVVGVSDDPGLLVGYGWIPTWLVRQGLTWRRCRMRRVLTDPFTGDLITVDGHTYPASWLHGDDPRPGGDPDRGSPGPHDSGGDGPGSDGPGSDGSGPGSSGSGSGGGSLDDPPREGPHPPGDSPTGSHAAPPPAAPAASGSAFGGGSRRAGAAVPSPSSGSARIGRFRGLPVQQLPPPRTEDDVLGPPLSEALLATLPALAGRALDSGQGADDACASGRCSPVDPTACPLDGSGGGRYTPTTALARHVRLTWQECTGPGSTVSAADSDLDHVVAYRADGSGGSTCSCNLEPKSRAWHRTKHATDPTTWRNPLDPTASSVPWTRRWRQWRCDQGSSHWVSPLGEAHDTRPRPITEPAGPFRRLVALVAPPAPVPAAGLTIDGRQQQPPHPVTTRSFPTHPDF